MFKEFGEFIQRGNVMELAVGIIIGAAFTAIVSALVDNIITPLIGLVAGGIDFSSLAFGVADAQITYGAFIQAIIDFLIIAWVVFMIVRAYNGFMKRLEKPKEPEAPAEPPKEEVLLTEIRDLLAKQAK